IDDDPKLVRMPNASTADFGDLRLQMGSHCVNVGNNALVAAPPFLMNAAGLISDLDGNARIADGNGTGTPVVDMGAYELPLPLVPIARGDTQTLIDAVQALIQLGQILPANGRPLFAKLDAAIS